MNNTDGIKLMFDHKEALTILARSLDPSKPNVMQQAVQVLAAICLIPPSGHERVLEAITMTGEIKGRERFQPVVQGLMVKSHPSLTVSYSIVVYEIPAMNHLFVVTILNLFMSCSSLKYASTSSSFYWNTYFLSALYANLYFST